MVHWQIYSIRWGDCVIAWPHGWPCAVCHWRIYLHIWRVDCVILHIWRVDCVILHIWRVDCVILHIWRVDCVILHIWRVDCVILHIWRVDCVILHIWRVDCVILHIWRVDCVILHIWRVDCVILHIWRVDCVILHIWRVDCVILHIWRVDCVILHIWRVNCVILHIWRVDCVILHIWRVDCVILHIWRVDCVILHIWRVDCVIQGAYHGWREPHPHPHPNCIVHDRRFNIASVFLLVSVCCDTAQAKAGRLGDIFSWLMCVWVWHWQSVICHCFGFADACAWWKHETDLCFVIFSACLRVMGMCLTTEASEAIMVESADLVKLAMVNLRTMRDDHSALFLFSWLDNLLGVCFCRICSVCIFFPLN